MYKGVPVIARAAGGVPEAMDGAGVMYDGLSHVELAQLFHRVMSDPALHEDVLSAQRARVQRALDRNVEQELRALLSGLL
jgi:glycosyltransferase involved in cell wall biosynthesis